MQKISVFIITKNEEDRVARAIKSVKSFADEILVIDSGSSDNTIKVAKEAGATTYYNEWAGYGPQKIYGESLCKNKWLLNLDADEEVTEELANEIKNLFNSKDIPNDRAGYFIK